MKGVYLRISWSTVSTKQVQGFQRVTIFDQISSVQGNVFTENFVALRTK